MRTFEGINKADRAYFTNGVKLISDKFKVSFKGTTAIVKYDGGISVDLDAMGKAYSKLKAFLVEFRQWQFNRNGA